MIWILSLMMSVARADFDTYEPAAKAHATVVFLHGGAWLSGDKKNYVALGKMFAAHGLRAIVANYRLSSVAKHPAPIDDLDSLLVGLKDERIFLLGHSAGAHLIAFWNTSRTSPRVRGFIGLEGIYDIADLVKKNPTYKEWFVAKEFGESSLWPAASPSLLKSKSTLPWLVIHSEKDELVQLSQSSDFAKHVNGKLLKLKTASHFEAVEQLEEADSEVSRAVLKFIAEH